MTDNDRGAQAEPAFGAAGRPPTLPAWIGPGPRRQALRWPGNPATHPTDTVGSPDSTQWTAGADRYVRATVGADGWLESLHIDPHAMDDLTAAELAEACTAAIQAAWLRCARRPTRRE